MHLKNIHTLNVRGCRNITDAGLLQLPNLQNVEISFCMNIKIFDKLNINVDYCGCHTCQIIDCGCGYDPECCGYDY